MTNQQQKNRVIIIVIFAMTIIPFLIAWGLKEHPDWVKGTNNKGQLIIPPVTTEWSEFAGFDAFSAKNIHELPGHWLIVNVIPQTQCNAVCLDALLKTKQLRLMLNKELSRTRRIVMVLQAPDSAAANLWWLKDSVLWRLRRNENPADAALFQSLLKEENGLDDALVDRLIAGDNREFALNSDLIRIKPNALLAAKLGQIRQGAIPDGMLFLIDPLGNIMMQYEPGFNAYQVRDDLMHLLKISQIG
ncbi:MAG: hypothetical protein HOP34_10230 [Methylococcaceae bacterium]|nr:hypothetical protein [Methylococcaceae bacterium]